MDNAIGREKGVALLGTPMEWLIIKKKKTDAKNGLKALKKKRSVVLKGWMRVLVIILNTAPFHIGKNFFVNSM